MGLADHQFPPFTRDKRLLRIKIGKSMICDDDFNGFWLLRAYTNPPSTYKVWPEMKSEAWVARKTAAPRRSLVSTKRPSVMRFRMPSNRAGSAAMVTAVNGVFVAVGAIEFTRMPSGNHSVDKLTVSRSTAAFEDE